MDADAISRAAEGEYHASEYHVRLAARMLDVGTDGPLVAAARKHALEVQGRSIIGLHIGEPDFESPSNVLAAAKRGLDNVATHYGPYMGIPALRDAIAADARVRKSLDVSSHRVVVAPGGKMAIYWAAMCLLQEGDEAIVPDPGFPAYEGSARLAGARVVPLPIREENDFRIDIDELRRLITRRTRLLVLNSPANPTGGVLTRDDLIEIARVCVKHDLWVLSDEIYSRIVYEGEHTSIGALPGMAERTVVVDGFSKTYAMTGWRLGYAIVPETLVDPFGKFAINTISCVAAFAQLGAVEALAGSQDPVDAMVAEFRARRNLLVAGLNEIPGFSCRLPAGAFYAFPNVAGTGLSGEVLADRLLTEAGVCVVAGRAYGSEGEAHIRLSYATDRRNLIEALARIRDLVVRLP